MLSPIHGHEGAAGHHFHTRNGAASRPTDAFSQSFSTALADSLQRLGFPPGSIQITIQEDSGQVSATGDGPRQYIVTISSASANAGSPPAAPAAITQDAATRPIDVPIDVWGWDRDKVMGMRRTYGYTWVPSLGMPPVEVAPGLAAFGNLRPYDPLNPPPGSILVPPEPLTELIGAPPPVAGVKLVDTMIRKSSFAAAHLDSSLLKKT